MLALGRQVVSGIQIQTAFALLHFEQGIALRPVEPETRYEIHTVGHNDRAVGSDPGKPGEEIKVLRLHLKVKPSATLQANPLPPPPLNEKAPGSSAVKREICICFRLPSVPAWITNGRKG